MSQILLIIIGVACVASGISSVLHSKKLQKEAGDEELLISQLKAALSEQYPPETFAEMMEDSDTTPELRYIQVQEEMKKALAGQFPAAASQLLDQLIEDYSDSMFS